MSQWSPGREKRVLVGVLAVLTLGLAGRAHALEFEVLPPNPAPGQAVQLELRGSWPTNCPLWASAVPDGPVRCEGCAIRAWSVQLQEQQDPECWAEPTPFTRRVNLGQTAAGTVVVAVYRIGDPQLGEPFEEFVASTEILVAAPTDLATFLGGRFQARVSWRSPSATGVGTVVASNRLAPPSSSALFWFFNPRNWELLVKMLDGCQVNGYFWVLGAGATDVEVDLEIEDTITGARWRHTNPLGTRVGSFTDGRAFPCNVGASP